MIEICWLGQGGFMINSGNSRILIDPYLSDCVFKKQQFARLHPFPAKIEDLKFDLLLITHDHMDHFDPEGVPELLAAYPECRCAGPQRSYEHFKALNVANDRLTLCKIGKNFTDGAFKITPIPAVHSDPTACGYLIEAEEKKIVLTGDSLYEEGLFVPEINNADLLLICINGKLGNMTDAEALEYVKKTAPACVLPMHYGLFAENTIDPQPFIDKCHAMGMKSFAMPLGEWFSF